MLKIENNKPVVYKESSTMGVLVFKEISKNIAKDIILKNHYSKKMGSNFWVT